MLSLEVCQGGSPERTSRKIPTKGGWLAPEWHYRTACAFRDRGVEVIDSQTGEAKPLGDAVRDHFQWKHLRQLYEDAEGETG